MNHKLLVSLVRKNLMSHKTTVIPFVLTTSILFALQYIMLSLVNNEYVQKRSSYLGSIIIFGNLISLFFIVIFIFYASRFAFKQRRQELSLYSILGLEKKHIRKILGYELLIQYIISSVLSLVGGYLFGNLIFMLLNQLMRNTGTRLMDYPFDLQSAVITLIGLAVIMSIIHIINTIKINTNNPIQLLQSKHSGEQEPKYKIVTLVLGFLLVGSGYYLALTTQGTISALKIIFIAIGLVALGTYFLYTSLSIFILKRMQAKKSLYYQPANFLSISGMLYRMKSNGMSLASITIMVTGIMMVLNLTLSTYRNMDSMADQVLEADYTINDFESMLESQEVEEIIDDMRQDVTIKDVKKYQGMAVSIVNQNGTFLPYNTQEEGFPTFAEVSGIVDHNNHYLEDLKLEDHQIGLSSSSEVTQEFSEITIADQTFEVVQLDKKYMMHIFGIEAFYVVLPETLSLEEVRTYYPRNNSSRPELSNISTQYNIHTEGDLTALEDRLNELTSTYPVIIKSKIQEQRHIFELNGGLLFIGIVVAIVLLVGTFLMLYFKQLSEGYQDQRNYQIMRQVGLPNPLIKKTIHRQIIWIFALPVSIAVLNMIVAGKITFQLLGLIGMSNLTIFLSSSIIIVLTFLVAYFVMYQITSKTYHRLINTK